MADLNEIKGQVADFYERHHGSKGKYNHLFGSKDRRDTLVRRVGTGWRILEVGCRSGNLTEHYCKGNEVVGVDVDRKALELFRERLGLEGHWIDVDFEPLPFPDASFDVVVFTEVMEHLRFPNKVLAEIKRCLKPNGRLIGSVPNSFRLRNRWRFLWGRPFETDPTHLRAYSPKMLRETLRREFGEVEIVPASGHLLGSGKYGLPVFHGLPYRIRRLFCSDLVFMCK